MHQDIKEILFTEEQIAARVRELGAQITKDYAGKTILMCGILKGAVTFFTDLARCIDGPVYFDFMSCSSYGSSTTSSGVLKIRKDLDNDVKDKDVLIVEDIVTTGGSIKEVVDVVNEAKGDIVGIGLLVDRSGGKADFGVPQEKVYPLLHLTVPTYKPEECPLCKEGVPITERGSHHLKK